MSFENQSKRIIILGANGMMGSMLHYLGSKNRDIFPITREKFDAMKDDVIILKNFLTDDCCIINCIGAIPQRNYKDDEFRKLNTEFPLVLSKFCEESKVNLIHISTNCVFSHEKSYRLETDAPDAEDVYGSSKASGEPSNCVVLRCSIIGLEINSSFGLLEWFFHSTGNIQGYDDHYWNGLTTLELSKVIYDIIDKKDFSPRIQHCYSPDASSKYQILSRSAEIFNKTIIITPVSKGVKHYTLSSKIYPPQKLSVFEQLTELFQISRDYRKFTGQCDIFLITSVINTENKPWSYTSIRSVFTPKQRFEQTLKTIDSIRNADNSNFIVLSECSDIDDSMINILREKVDLFIHCFSNEEIKQSCIQSNKKGYGELLQTKDAVQKIQEMNIRFNRFFKISGRYWLNGAFDKSKFSVKEYSFNQILPGATCHPTVLYSVPSNLIEHFKDVLNQCNEVYKSKIIGLEILLPPLCEPKIKIDAVGVSGYVAVDGSYYSVPPGF